MRIAQTIGGRSPNLPIISPTSQRRIVLLLRGVGWGGKRRLGRGSGHERHVGGQPKPIKDSLVLGLLIQFHYHTLFSTAAGKPTEPVVDQLTLADVLSRR